MQMGKNNNRRPFKVMLDDKSAKALSIVAARWQAERDNYQIGVGTVITELLESLATHPDLLVQVLDELELEQDAADSNVPPLKKAGGGKRNAA